MLFVFPFLKSFFVFPILQDIGNVSSKTLLFGVDSEIPARAPLATVLCALCVYVLSVSARSRALIFTCVPRASL